MRLEDNFYKIHNRESVDGVCRVEVELLPDHPIYAGHFPQQPVVPGVCTLTIIKECIAKDLGCDVAFAAVKECKYMSALIPESGLRIVVEYSVDDEKGVKATVKRAVGGEVVLKLRATLR